MKIEEDCVGRREKGIQVQLGRGGEEGRRGDSVRAGDGLAGGGSERPSNNGANISYVDPV